MTSRRWILDADRRVFLALGFGILLGIAGEAIADPIDFRIAPQFRSWSFDQPAGSVDLSQTYIPVDAYWRQSETLRVSGGIDLVSTAQDGLGASSDLKGLGELRLGAEKRVSSDLIRIGASARMALHEDGLAPAQVRVARIMEIPQLFLPLPRVGAGNQFALHLGSQLIRRSQFLLHLGMTYELLGAYEMRDDGLELDPGDRLQLLGSADYAYRGLTFRSGLALESLSRSQVDGADAYGVGSITRIFQSVSRRKGVSLFAIDLDFLATSTGELYDSTFNADAIRGGNRFVWELSATRSGPWTFRYALSGTSHRGFSGPLGHSDWLTPSILVSKRAGRGDLRFGLDLSFGEGRNGQSVGGLGLEVSWIGGLF